MEKLIFDWDERGDLKETLILAGSNLDVTALNRMAQEKRLAAGLLDKEFLYFNGEDFHVRDRILFTRNSSLHDVKNGQLATIENIEGKAITVRMDDGNKRKTIHIEDYDHLKLGYAMTTHKAQGVTVDKSYVLVGGVMQDRELSYVQMSRARKETRLYTDLDEAGEELADVANSMSRSRQKEMAIVVQQRAQMEMER